MNVIEKLLEKDILVDPDEFGRLTEQQLRQLEHSIDELGRDEIEQFLQRGTVEVIRSYTKKPTKRTYQHFVGHFAARLDQIGTILRTRQELGSPQSISHLKQDQQAAIIGLVWDKYETKNGHLMLTLEDRTGKTKVLLSKKRQELLDLGKDIMLDEVIGVTGLAGEDIVFADNVYLPDVPPSNELKKAPDEAYAVFLADLHFGNKEFLTSAFQNVIDWLRGELGSDAHKRIARKVKYVFIPGDMIEGVGIYPNQEEDLSIKDIREQYKLFSEWIAKIPRHIQIVMCPGNHDAGRLAEPQMNLYDDFTQDLIDQPNVHLVSSPGWVRFHRTKDFEGFVTLLYHGNSFIYYGNNVPSIFDAGAVNEPTNIMRYLLQRRHLAPTHASFLYVPDPVEDPLVIKDIPDFFASGHVHIARSENYRGVTMLTCSCWVPITDNQRSYGLTPDPGKIALVNLKTRQTRFLSFHKEDEDE